MSSGLLEIVKQAALNVIENKQMCDLRYGEVVSVSPLKIRLTPQLTIPDSLLIVPQHLTDYSTDYSVQVNTDGTNSTVSGGTLLINNGLKIGDKVALIRKQGGQSYFVLGRI